MSNATEPVSVQTVSVERTDPAVGAYASRLVTASPSRQLNAVPYRPVIEAEAVREPLQPRSAAFQRMCRAQLLSRLSRILPTRDTPRGLVVTIPGWLLNSSNNVPDGTADRLAKIVEILPPDVNLRVEGYSEDLGSDSENQNASYGRAQLVRDVLASNDDLSHSIVAAGLISTATGLERASRRVEIVISGPGIGQRPLQGRAYAMRH